MKGQQLQSDCNEGRNPVTLVVLEWNWQVPLVSNWGNLSSTLNEFKIKAKL